MAEKLENVWTLEEGEIRKPGIAHVVALALFTGIGIVVGTFGSLAVPIGFVSAFWPGQAIQAVGSVWYGMWGGVAAFVFPLISNAMSGSAPLPVSLAYIPGNLIQGIAAGWVFRQFKLNPSLKSGKDWLGFTLVGIILANAFGALWGTWVLRIFGLITPDAHVVAWAGWFLRQQRRLLDSRSPHAEVHHSPRRQDEGLLQRLLGLIFCDL